MTDLFSDSFYDPELSGLGSAIPSGVHFGTSTWTYPGWTGLVYSRAYPSSGSSTRMLEEYSRFPLFSTVGIDSSFYGPPKPTTLARWGAVLPRGFRCVSKVWERLTVHTFADPERSGQPNPDFLDADLFRSEVWTPYRESFAEHMGPFVFEFQTMGRGMTPDRFVEQLDGFLGRLPPEGEYAVELRNEDFLIPAYFAVMREHGAAHVFNSWTRMPSLGEQLDVPGSITARFVVARALLKPGRAYAEAVDQFAPYDRVREANPRIRSDLARLARNASALRLPAYLLVNNRVEGSAPLTIAAVARLLRDGETSEPSGTDGAEPGNDPAD